MTNRFEESNIQQAIIRWAKFASCTQPELKLLHSIPNGANVSIANRRRLIAEGLLKGMPDLCLPISKENIGALYLEIKTSKGRTTKDQEEVHRLLHAHGNLVIIIRSVQEAIDIINKYLEH